MRYYFSVILITTNSLFFKLSLSLDFFRVGKRRKLRIFKHFLKKDVKGSLKC